MSIGVVIIGRNEGKRLIRCLESVKKVSDQIVYVDSGSTDSSVSSARGMGAEVVALDMTIPFTAARARNEGSQVLGKLAPALQYIQFVDGDCELVNGWLNRAAEFMDSNSQVAMVCGRLRERHPEQSIYNFMMDSEWDTPAGATKACGGIAMVRMQAFLAVAGFRSSLIAGEESELCVRMRVHGWQIWRLDIDMALHDAAMTRFSQWWRRSMRGGYAYAEGAHLHGKSPERHRVKESRRIWLWGLCIPVVTISLIPSIGAWSLILLLIYPAQVFRLALRGSRTSRENWLRAFFLVLGKFPETMGQIKFIYNRLTGKNNRLIEYK